MTGYKHFWESLGLVQVNERVPAELKERISYEAKRLRGAHMISLIESGAMDYGLFRHYHNQRLVTLPSYGEIMALNKRLSGKVTKKLRERYAELETRFHSAMDLRRRIFETDVSDEAELAEVLGQYYALATWINAECWFLDGDLPATKIAPAPVRDHFKGSAP